MGRPTVYGRRLRVYVTPEHLAHINREATLTGVTPSAVMRAALTAYFARPHQPSGSSGICSTMRPDRADPENAIDPPPRYRALASPDVQAEAAAAGHSWVTVKRASVELGLEKTRVRSKDGKKAIQAWEWSLPDGLKWSAG